MPSARQVEYLIDKCRRYGRELSRLSKDYYREMKCPFCRATNYWFAVRFILPNGRSPSAFTGAWTWDVNTIAECKRCKKTWNLFEVPQEVSDVISASPMIDAEINKHYEQTLNRWINSTEEERNSSRFLRDIASEFLAVVKQANGMHPEAHGRLSEVFLALGEEDKAKQEYRAALEQTPYEPSAWKTRIAMTLESFGSYADFARNTRELGGLPGMLGRSAINREKRVAAKQNIIHFAEAYRLMINNSSNTVIWLNMSDLMLQVGDVLLDAGLTKGWPNLFAEVANAPWHKIDQVGYEEDIAEIRRTAEGRSMLY